MDEARAEALFNSQADAAIGLATLFKDVMVSNDLPGHLVLLAHAMAASTIVAGAIGAANHIGAEGVVKLNYGDRLGEAAELLRLAADGSDDVLRRLSK